MEAKMAILPFEANVRQAPAAAVIDLSGEIDGFSEAALNSAYAQATEGNQKAVLLNFSRVDYMNSTGIALIVGLLAQARKSGRRLLTYGLSDHYQEIFKITRLSDFMSIHADEASALAHVGADGAERKA
jgi:anti-anti-sigma factor